MAETVNAEVPTPVSADANANQEEETWTMRRPITSFLRYVASERSNIIESILKDPEYSGDPEKPPPNPMVSQKAGENWRKMSEEDKKPYTEAAKSAREEYITKRKEFELRNPHFVIVGGKSNKRKKPTDSEESVSPKKQRKKPTLSAYRHWLKSEREKIKAHLITTNGVANLPAISKEAGIRWNSISKETKDQLQKEVDDLNKAVLGESSAQAAEEGDGEEN